MDLVISGKTLSFREREHSHYLVAPYVLPAWADYRSENSRPDFLGENVLFILQSPTQIGPSDADHYTRLISWFLDKEPEIHAAAIAAITEFVMDLKNTYRGGPDEELDTFESSHQLKHMIDLYAVRFHDELACSEPSFGLEFECNWDPEHGCGVLFEGTRVEDVGGSESSHGP